MKSYMDTSLCRDTSPLLIEPFLPSSSSPAVVVGFDSRVAGWMVASADAPDERMDELVPAMAGAMLVLRLTPASTNTPAMNRAALLLGFDGPDSNHRGDGRGAIDREGQ